MTREPHHNAHLPRNWLLCLLEKLRYSHHQSAVDLQIADALVGAHPDEGDC